MLARHPAVQAAIDSIIAELERAQSGITGARPADPARAADAAGWLERNRAIRGNGTFYPYVGDGFGKGPLVQLADGSVKWDMINGIGVHMFGHGDDRMLAAALRAGLADTCMQGNLASNADSVAFADFLVTEARRASRMAHCFVTNSGCMANESALKVCMQRTNGAPRVLAFQDCFTGRSITMSQIGDNAAYRQGVPLSTLVDYMPFYDPLMGARSIDMAVWHLKQYIHRYPGQHACFVMELVQGEGGFNTAPREFFVALMETCRAANIPVWDDEVQSFGRTETMFAYESLGVGHLVDVVTVGKMTQACACLMAPEFNPKPGLLSGTFTASTSAFHVGLEALRTMRDGGYYGADGRNARLHAAFRRHAEALIARHPAWFPEVKDAFGRPGVAKVGGTGGMCRFTPFGGEKDPVMKLLTAMFEEGVMAFYCGHGPYHLRMLAPVGVMEPAHWEPVFEIIERSMAKIGK